MRLQRWAIRTAILAVMLASAGCAANSRSDAPEDAAATPITVSPEATSPEATESTPPAGTTIASTVSIQNGNNYTYDITFSATVGGAPTVNTADSKPGQAKVTWSPVLDGSFSITNTTAGHTLPIPDWLALPCTADPNDCLSLFGFWPATSPVCAVKTVDEGNRAYDNTGDAPVYSDIYIAPAGKWCVIRYGQAGSLEDPSGKLPLGGSGTSRWGSNEVTMVLLNENDSTKLADAFAAGPKVWVVASPTWAQESTKNSLKGCVNAAPTIFWSSGPITCQHQN